ncbi:MAG: hypothetical protein C0397_08730 [Odoribacter sp.]|nr:hypothetical protein [Odoribacter sp.]
MKFTEIIKRNSWLSVEQVFLQLYPKEKKNISGYEAVFNDLKLLSPTETDISIVENKRLYRIGTDFSLPVRDDFFWI